jgi:hypothetical protein
MITLAQLAAALNPRRSSIVKRAPSPEETALSMGSIARRKFVALKPCAACGIEWHSQNAHLLGPAGMGLKKGPETIGPLCGPSGNGCHQLYDRRRWVFDAKYPWFKPEEVAAKTQTDWLAFNGAAA